MNIQHMAVEETYGEDQWKGELAPSNYLDKKREVSHGSLVALSSRGSREGASRVG